MIHIVGIRKKNHHTNASIIPQAATRQPPPSLLCKLRAHEHKPKAQNAPSARVRIAPSRGQGRKKPTTTKAAVGLVILKFLNPLIFFSSFQSFFHVFVLLSCTPGHTKRRKGRLVRDRGLTFCCAGKAGEEVAKGK